MGCGQLDGIYVSAAKAFRNSLTGDDFARLRACQVLHMCSLLVPLGLYQAGTSDTHPLFPCTISWSIRRGVPRWTNHACWITAWCLSLTVLRKRAHAAIKVFGWQMFVTGIVTVILCPAGSGGWSERVHMCGAFLYMIDHQIFSGILAIRRSYVAGFWACFLAFLTGTAVSKRLCPKKSVDDDLPYLLSESCPTEPDLRRQLWWCELLRMLAENGMFISFISGMLSGLPRRNLHTRKILAGQR